MNDLQLEAFVRAFEDGSFRKAAKGQFLTLPAFVRRITSLEEELHVRLFTRNPQGIVPTDSGETFYPHAKLLLSSMETAKNSVIQEPEINCIRVGIWWKAPAVILDAIKEFSEQHPKVKIDFIETNWNSFAGDLASNKIDVYFGESSYQALEKGLEFTECCRKSFHCAFSPQSKLAQYDTIKPEYLENHIVYAGGDWRTVPDLTPEAISFFSRDNVVKESIFTNKLMIDCMQDEAVAIFFESIMDDMMPTLEARPFNWPSVPAGANHRKSPSAILQTFIDIGCTHMKRATQ